MYAIKMSRAAQKALSKYERGDPRAHGAAVNTIAALKQDPYLHGCSAIRNKGLQHCEGTTLKIDTDGTHRLVYAVIDERKEIFVVTFDHRHSVYKVK